MKGVKAYKVFNNNWNCRGFQFKVGGTYIFDGELKICKSGFHACTELRDCFAYYPLVQWNKFAEVELLGEVKGHDSDSKKCTDKIKIIKELSFDDVIGIVGDNVNDSTGVNDSKGVNYSIGVNDSKGVNYSIGVNYSKGVNDSIGVNRCIGGRFFFCSNQKTAPLLFNAPVIEERYNKIMGEYQSIVGDWCPQYNNAIKLYKANGEVWERTPIPDIAEQNNKEAWADMPTEAIKYLTSLPEYDEQIFFEITGIKVKKNIQESEGE